MATTSLIKVVFAARDHCHRASEELRSLEQARLSSQFQITSLRVLYRALSTNLDKYNCDVERSLSKSDRDAIGDIIQDIDRIADKSEETVVKLKKAIQKSGNNRTELDMLRDELNTAVSVIQSLQTAFASFVTRPPNEVNI